MARLAALLALVGCASPKLAEHRAALASSVADCLAPRPAGESQRVVIQAALDAAAAAPDGGTVCLGPGRWSLDRAPIGSYNRFAALTIRGHHVTLRGVGPETVLEVAGDQGGSTTIAADILPGAAHVRIADLTCDLSGTTNTAEQTHCIATSGTCAGESCQPIQGVLIERVRFVHPRNTETRKGDCIRLLGNAPETRLHGVRIVNNDFAECARSAIGIQRGVYDLVIAGNTIAARKTCIDGEATGAPHDIDARLVVTGNVFRSGCEPAISLTTYTGAAITGNSMAGAVTVYRSKQVAIASNTIEHVAGENIGTIDVGNVCDGLAITGNTITRTGIAGPVLRLEPHSGGGVCTDVAVTGNTLRQGTPFHAVYLESVSRAAIAANLISFTAPAPSMSGIYERSVIAAAPVTSVGITGNVITGPATYAVTLQAHPASFGAGIVLSGNTAVGPTFGLYCKDINYTAPITSSGNAWAAGVGPSANVIGGVP